MHWHDLARQQAGVIARRDLERCGLSADEIDGLIRRRQLAALLPGVYSPRPVPRSRAQAEWAAVLWSGGVLSHGTAARWWRLPVTLPRRVHVTVADRRFRKASSEVRIHRVPLEPAEYTYASGLPLTTRGRTVIDLLRTERYEVVRDLRDRALQQGWLDLAAITGSVSRQIGRTGNAQLRRLVAELEPGAHAESERRLHTLLRKAGLSGWYPQFEVRIGNRTAYVDVAFPEYRLAIEVDGRRYHDDTTERFESDRRRQNDLIASGWRVLRFTWSMLVTEPDRVIARIVQLLAA
jgi:very-short-patch-repair endonuclease